MDRLRFTIPNSPNTALNTLREKVNQAIENPTRTEWSQEGKCGIEELIEMLITLVSEETHRTLRIDSPTLNPRDLDTPPPPPPQEMDS